MAKQFSELDNRISDGQIVLRFKRSESFFKDASAAIDLGGTSLISIWICRILTWVGCLALVGVLALAFYIWTWDSSPLTDTVQARVLNIDKQSQGGVVNYEYKVGNKTYAASQYSNSLESNWRNENSTAEVVYLNFMPGTSKLTKTAEPMDWSILLLGPILPLGFMLGGYLGKRSVQRMARIEDNATHLLDGTVTNHIPGKGMVVVQYKATSPETGNEIFGGVEIGRLEPVLSQMQIGTPVAVVYANRKDHTLL